MWGRWNNNAFARCETKMKCKNKPGAIQTLRVYFCARKRVLLRKGKINRKGAEGAKKTTVTPLRSLRLCGESQRFATRTT
jgi:hypothetical protein